MMSTLEINIQGIQAALSRHPQRKSFFAGMTGHRVDRYRAIDSALQAMILIQRRADDEAVYNWARSAASYGLDALGR